MKIEEKEAEFIEKFNILEDWMFQFDYLLMCAASMEPLTEEERCKEHCVEGCQSKVWIVAEENNGKIHLRADSYSMLIKGILGILLLILNEHDAEEIMNYDIKLFTQTAIGEQLTADRHLGIKAILRYIKNEMMKYI